MLTCCLYIYPKGEDRAYTQANPQNFQPLFNPRQVLMAVMMDLVATHHQIQSALAHNPYTQEHLRRLEGNMGVNSDDKPFSLSDDKLLLCNKQIMSQTMTISDSKSYTPTMTINLLDTQ